MVIHVVLRQIKETCAIKMNGYMVNVFPQTYFDGVVVENIRLCGRPVPAEQMKIGMVGEDRIDMTYL